MYLNIHIHPYVIFIYSENAKTKMQKKNIFVNYIYYNIIYAHNVNLFFKNIKYKYKYSFI